MRCCQTPETECGFSDVISPRLPTPARKARLDPFIGSGSTAEVALQNDRAVVGFEIDAQYVQVAASRLDAYFERRRYEASQLGLFDIAGVVEDD